MTPEIGGAGHGSFLSCQVCTSLSHPYGFEALGLAWLGVNRGVNEGRTKFTETGEVVVVS